MGFAGFKRQAVGGTEAWLLNPDKGVYALYTQHPEVKNLARKTGLRQMGEYYYPDGAGGARLAAWQFAGDKEEVTQVLAGAKKLEAKRRARPAEARGICASCGQPFAAQGKRQKYCRTCASEAARRRKREWKASKGAVTVREAENFR